MRIALYQPEIPQNVGTILRLCACLQVPAHIIHPCNFPFDSSKIKRSLMDYWSFVQLTHHDNWGAFQEKTQTLRSILLDVHAATPYHRFTFHPNDILIVGRESDGFSPEVKKGIAHHVSIPMHAHTRSLNVATALSMILGEALRQTLWSQP